MAYQCDGCGQTRIRPTSSGGDVHNPNIHSRMYAFPVDDDTDTATDSFGHTVNDININIQINVNAMPGRHYCNECFALLYAHSLERIAYDITHQKEWQVKREEIRKRRALLAEMGK